MEIVGMKKTYIIINGGKMKELRETYIHIKVSEKEKEKLKSNAEKAGMTISQYIRTKCIYKGRK
jgi:hypothetical protein